MTDEVTVRDAAPTDWTRMTELLIQLGYATRPDADLAEQIAPLQERGGVVVAEVDGHISGFASYDRWFAFAENTWVCRINAICVDSASRRRGVGRALLEEIEHRARRSRCGLIELSSGRRAERASAHLLYRNSGYEDRTSHHVTYAKRIGAPPTFVDSLSAPIDDEVGHDA